MNKRILIVGVLDVPSSTNVFMKWGFEQLGYYVEAYNYRTKAKELGVIAMWSDFRDSLKDREYDLIVFCKTNQMHPELLSYAKKHGPVWYWFMDPLATAGTTMATEYAKYANYASATASNVVEKFKAVNLNSFHIIEGYDDEMYFYEDLEKIYDITFIGNATLERCADIRALQEAGVEVTVFGSGWPQNVKANAPVYNKEERKVINQSKIVLNLCQDDTIFSDRVVKASACGAAIVSQNCKDLEDFPYGIHEYEDLFNKFLFKLLKEHFKILGVIRQATTQNIKENYSWKAVCARILDKI